MRILFLLLTTFFLVTNCKGNNKDKLVVNEAESIKKNDSLVVISSIDKKSIGTEIKQVSKDKLLELYKMALERDFERPHMWDTMIAENRHLVKFYNYKSFEIHDKKYKTYYINIKYEDALYEAILLIISEEKNENKPLMLYENLDSEEKYQRITHELKNHVLAMEFKKDEKVYKKQSYIVKNNMILDYFDENGNINKSWGNMEEVDSNGMTGEIKEYLMRGKVANNIKNDAWEERRYSFEYDKNIWMNGKYINGVRDGEWSLSPNGPVDKIVIYKNGEIIKSYSP